jgi:hypothetical protein
MGASVRSCVITGLVVILVGVAWSNDPLHAEDSRDQHREWMRKLETPGGTFPYALDMSLDAAGSSLLLPEETAPQHRSWMRKLETPGGTLRSL